MQLLHVHVLLFTLHLFLQLATITRGFTTVAVTTPSPHCQHPTACRRHHRGSAPSASGSHDYSDVGQAEELVQTNLLAQIQRSTTIWADTGNVGVVQRFASTAGVLDVTTNPSIVLATVQRELGAGDFRPPKARGPCESLSQMAERVAVDMGCRLLQVVPGRVCTQLDIRCQDADVMVAKARSIMAMYAEAGVPKERVLIKTPATWAGIRATQILEAEGIKCLVTLVCSELQGRAAAEAEASVIATYVGRVSDWHKQRAWDVPFPASASEDPGVVMTNRLQHFVRDQGLRTEVMAASFRSVDQVAALAGCDHLTIAPALIDELAATAPMETLADVPHPGAISREAHRFPAQLDEKSFLEFLEADLCGTDVLCASMGDFGRDTEALESCISQALQL